MKTRASNAHNPLIASILIGTFILAPFAVTAQGEDHNKRVIYQRLLNKFDHNGDGALTEGATTVSYEPKCFRTGVSSEISVPRLP